MTGNSREGTTRPEGAKEKNRQPLPDPEICRARHVARGEAECLVENPIRCPHKLHFGNGYFCMHPERKQIVARTEREKHARK